MERKATEAFEEWAIVELMGHRRLAGKVIEATIGGHPITPTSKPAPVQRWELPQPRAGEEVDDDRPF